MTRDIVLAYLRAIESHDLDAVAALLHDDVEVIEHPNKLSPKGGRADKPAIRAAGERGAALMQRERYEVRSMIVEGSRAAVQVAWLGVMRDGREVRADICSIIELRDGKVWRQEQYDCFRES